MTRISRFIIAERYDQYEALCCLPTSVRGTWDPAKGEGKVMFVSKAAADAARSQII